MTGLLSRMSATFIITLLFLQAVMAYELGAPNCNFALSKRGLSNAHCRSLCEDVEFGEATPHEFSRECSFEYYDAHGVASSNTCVGNTSIASRAYTRLSDVHSFAECQDLCREQEDCAWVMARSKGDALSCEYLRSADMHAAVSESNRQCDLEEVQNNPTSPILCPDMAGKISLSSCCVLIHLQLIAFFQVTM